MFALLLISLLFATTYSAVQEKTLTMKAIDESHWATTEYKYVSEEFTDTLAAPKDYVVYVLDMSNYYSNINKTDGLQLNASALVNGERVEVLLSSTRDFNDLNGQLDTGSWDSIPSLIQTCDLKSQKYYLRLRSSIMNQGPVTVHWHASIEIQTQNWLCYNPDWEEILKAMSGLLIFGIVMSVICGLCCLGVIISVCCGTGAVCCMVCCKKEEDNNPRNPLLKEV